MNESSRMEVSRYFVGSFGGRKSAGRILNLSSCRSVPLFATIACNTDAIGLDSIRLGDLFQAMAWVDSV